MKRELGRRSSWRFTALAGGFFLVLFAGSAAARERGAHFEFDRLSDHLGGRQSTVYEIFEDPFGFLWFAGDTDGILRFDSEDWVSWSDGLVENNARSNISTVRVSDDGRLWVGSWGNGLQYWDGEQQTFVQFLADQADPHALAANRVQRLMIDSRDRLWIGTTAGINLIESGRPEQIRRFAHDQPDHPLHALFCEAGGRHHGCTIDDGYGYMVYAADLPQLTSLFHAAFVQRAVQLRGGMPVELGLLLSGKPCTLVIGDHQTRLVAGRAAPCCLSCRR
ncbi:MAG: ligand-binding sensor domain-containing protein, partial [Wenzhouxiangella sp.]